MQIAKTQERFSNIENQIFFLEFRKIRFILFFIFCNKVHKFASFIHRLRYAPSNPQLKHHKAPIFILKIEAY